MPNAMQRKRKLICLRKKRKSLTAEPQFFIANSKFTRATQHSERKRVRIWACSRLRFFFDNRWNISQRRKHNNNTLFVRQHSICFFFSIAPPWLFLSVPSLSLHFNSVDKFFAFLVYGSTGRFFFLSSSPLSALPLGFAIDIGLVLNEKCMKFHFTSTLFTSQNCDSQSMCVQR